MELNSLYERKTGDYMSAHLVSKIP